MIERYGLTTDDALEAALADLGSAIELPSTPDMDVSGPFSLNCLLWKMPLRARCWRGIGLHKAATRQRRS